VGPARDERRQAGIGLRAQGSLREARGRKPGKGEREKPSLNFFPSVFPLLFPEAQIRTQARAVIVSRLPATTFDRPRKKGEGRGSQEQHSGGGGGGTKPTFPSSSTYSYEREGGMVSLTAMKWDWLKAEGADEIGLRWTVYGWRSEKEIRRLKSQIPSTKFQIPITQSPGGDFDQNKENSM